MLSRSESGIEEEDEIERRTGIACGARLLLFAGIALAPPGARAFDYAESINGDVASDNENAPTLIGTLDPGVNTVSGSFSWIGDIFDGDVFAVDVPAGIEIEGITLVISSHSGGFNAATKVFETPVFQGIDYRSFPADGSYDFVGPPLPPGRYGFTTVSEGGTVPPASYTWQWTIRAPEPTPLGASLAAALSMVGIARARRA